MLDQAYKSVSEAEIRAFSGHIGLAPLAVCDMDGNILDAFNVVPGKTLPEKYGQPENADVQSIPFGTSAKELKSLVKAGVLSMGIFAEKGMDVRMNQKLVQAINAMHDDPEPKYFAILTSRPLQDAQRILEESGLNHPEKIILVADSGATMLFEGKKTLVRAASEEEKQFLNSTHDIAQSLNQQIKQLAWERSDKSKNLEDAPDLYVEIKAIAANIHYRSILNFFSLHEGGREDLEMAAIIQQRLEASTKEGPRNEHGKETFKTLLGPCTVEVKIASVHKGIGLEKVVQEALDQGYEPSSIVFSGDDVANNGKPGTDYYAMAAGPRLKEKFGLPFYNIHTHHQIGDRFDPGKDPISLTEEFEKPHIHLRFPTPEKLAGFLASILTEQARVPRTPPERHARLS